MPKHTFLYEKELLTSLAIGRISDTLKFLFRKLYMSFFLLVALLGDFLFFFYTENILIFNNVANAYVIIGLIILMLLSSFFHELGHASACRFYGVNHGGIGIGLYLNFPVLYTDVTNAWRLKRKQRLIVDIAGIYFQSIFLVIILLFFLFTHYDILRYIILIMNLGILITLNPFFKFDGYWIVSDLLGISNLRIRSKAVIVCWLKQICRLSQQKDSYLFDIHPLAKYGLFFYAIMINVFMGYYILEVIPHLINRLVDSFPNLMSELIFYLSNNITPPFALLRNIGSQLLMGVFIGYFVLYSLILLIKKYVNR